MVRANTFRPRRKSCCSATAAPRWATVFAWRRRSGAATSDGMNNFYGHLHSRDAMTNTKLWPRPVRPTISPRPASSSTPTAAASPTRARAASDLSNAIARLPDPLGTTIIFDHAIWDGPPGRDHAQPPNPLVSRPAARCIAPTRSRSSPKDRTCRRSGCSDVVAEYNKAIDQGALQKLSPPRRSDPHKAWPIRTAPFYAMPICAAITNTMGGIVVDGDARVLDTERQADPGPVRRRLHRRRARRRSARRLRRRPDQGHHRTARRGDDRAGNLLTAN